MHYELLSSSSIVVVGQRVHCIMYGGKDGTVVNIHGTQDAKSCKSLHGVGVRGGRAHFDIIWDNGTESRQIPESLLRSSVQWRVYSEIFTADQITIAKTTLEAETNRRNLEKLENQRKWDLEVVELKAKYPNLKQQQDEPSAPKRAIANIRIELKEKWPKVKFSVRKDGYNTLNISWIDGPTVDQVENITAKYKEGYFDGMEDIYRNVATPFNTLFGDLKYIFNRRDYSDAVKQKSINELWLELPANLENIPKIDVSLWCKDCIQIPCLNITISEALRSIASSYDAFNDEYRLNSRYSSSNWLVENIRNRLYGSKMIEHVS